MKSFLKVPLIFVMFIALILLSGCGSDDDSGNGLASDGPGPNYHSNPYGGPNGNLNLEQFYSAVLNMQFAPQHYFHEYYARYNYSVTSDDCFWFFTCFEDDHQYISVIGGQYGSASQTQLTYFESFSSNTNNWTPSHGAVLSALQIRDRLLAILNSAIEIQVGLGQGPSPLIYPGYIYRIRTGANIWYEFSLDVPMAMNPIRKYYYDGINFQLYQFVQFYFSPF